MKRLSLLVLALGVLAHAACDDGKKNSGKDVSVDTVGDASGDTSQDATPDTKLDATVDVTLDTKPDTTTDATPDTTTDAAPDTTTDATPDTTTDATPDTAVDTTTDTVADTDPDVTTDAVADATDAVAGCDPACGTGQVCNEFNVCVTVEGNEKPLGCDTAHGLSGCCGPDGKVYWFEDGALQVAICEDNSCGWDGDNGFYSCSSSFVGGDPSGTYPLTCGLPNPAPDDCVACTPVCDGKVCGDDGCGGLCGYCDDGEFCGLDGTCGGPTCGGACGSPNEQPGGCYCESGCFSFGDCCDDICDVCADVFTEPAPNGCGICVPDCEGKTCGSDGCGDVCGTCESDEICNDAQTCEVCTPACEGKACGVDGCGGECGVCSEGLVCLDEGTSAVCVDPLSESCAGLCGVFKGEGTCNCDAGCFATGDCCTDICTECSADYPDDCVE